MRSATVIQAATVSHPESGRRCLRVTVDYPYYTGGAPSPTRALWVDPICPAPNDGETVEWDASHVWVRGVRYRLVEDDSAV